VLVAGLGLGPGAPRARAQSEPASRSDLAALRSELETLRAEIQGLRNEMRLIREFLAQRPAQTPQAPRATARVSVAGHPVMGRNDAPLTLIEFSDYQCPFCRRFFESTLPGLKAEYVETGKLRYVFRDFPIDSIHPHARKAAEAARCAGAQGKYWEMHDLLFRNQQALQVEQLKGHARGLGLDASAFDACLESSSHGAGVQRDYDDGFGAGVRGTPTFFLGKTQPGDTIEGGPITGARPLSDFRREIDRLLGDK
jgi:protein-disulfide isomerase